ncbi:MAG: hypothetical protein Q4C05_00875 [Akkermansia sp.]|nr:hypothetical protein [Akkermansia sp.]
MKYVLLIILIVAGAFGWDYYQMELVPREAELAAMKEPAELVQGKRVYAELSAVQLAKVDVLQKEIERKEAFIREYWENRQGKAELEKWESATEGKSKVMSAETRKARLLAQYDKRALEVDKMRDDMLSAEQELGKKKFQIEEELRKVASRLDVNRIQEAEARNTKSSAYKVDEKRSDLLKLQASLTKKLEKVTQSGEAKVAALTKKWKAADYELKKLQITIDERITEIDESESYGEGDLLSDAAMMVDSPEFLQKLKPYDKAIDEAEQATNDAETARNAQGRIVRDMQREYDAKLLSMKQELDDDMQKLKMYGGAGGVLLFIVILSIIRRR